MFGDVAFSQAPFASLGGNSYFRTIEETATANSVLSVESVRGGFIVEAITASDASSTSGNLLRAAVAELVNALASPAANSSVKAAIAQSASGIAAPSATSLANGTVAESATGADATARVMFTSRSVAEAAAGTDSYIGSKVWYRTMEESAAGTALHSVSLAALAQLRESATALDTLSVIKTLHANVTGVQLYINVGDALIWVVVDDNQNPSWQNIPT